MAPSRRQLGLRAAYSGLSSVAGYSIFIVWTVVYSQPWTAAMGGLAGTAGLRGRWAGWWGEGGALLPRLLAGGTSRGSRGGVYPPHPLAAQASSAQAFPEPWR